MFSVTRRDLVLGAAGACAAYGINKHVAFIGAAYAQQTATQPFRKYKIGDIESVVRENGRAFALVRSGLFGTLRRLVPLNDVRESGDELVVPYSKDKVKLAPPANADRRLSPAERERL